MDEKNIISTHTIPNLASPVIPIGLVDTGVFGSTDEVLNDAVRIGNEMGADWIVGFNFQSEPTFSRADRRWSGFGTAVKLRPRRSG